jgi:hypothetical protein
MSSQPFDPSDSPTLTRGVGDGVTHGMPASPGGSLVPGQSFGPYLIRRLLGKGGMGEVYEAEQRESGRRVALKVLADPDPLPEARERFLREGRLAAAVNHPNSVYIYGTEEIEGQWAISMELLGGGSLKDRMRDQGPLPPTEAVDAILQVIDGLEAAAAAGVLHRDIKPANCFVELDGTVKIGDFGLSLSTLARDRSKSHLTQSGTFLGTPAFASPEQLRGDDIDVRSDIYSVGATLYYLMTGRPPFEADNLMQLLTTIAEKPPESPRKLQSNIPRGLANLVLQCLAKSPESRPHDYASLRGSLAGFGASHEVVDASGRQTLAALLDPALAYGLAFLAMPSLAIWSRDPIETGDQWRAMAALLVSSIVVFSPFAVGSESLVERLLGVRVLTKSGSTLSLRQRWTRWAVACVVTTIYGGIGDYPMSLVSIFTFLCLAFILARLKAIRAIVRVRPFNTSALLSSDPSWERIGPYFVLAEAPRNSTVVVAVDPLLKRRVWVRRLSEGEAMDASEAQGSTRLRWLGSGRDAKGLWRAYEAPGGKPLTQCESVPWPAARFVIRDLALDLATAFDQASLPSSVSLQHVWVEGRETCRLLEFIPPGSTEGDHRKYSSRDEHDLLVFLHDIVLRLVSTLGRDPLLPRNADRFLQDLGSGAISSLRQAAVVAALLARGEITTRRGLSFGNTLMFGFVLVLTTMPEKPRNNILFLLVGWSLMLAYGVVKTALLVRDSVKPPRKREQSHLGDVFKRVRADGSEVSDWASWRAESLVRLPSLVLAGLALRSWPDGHWNYVAPLLGLALLEAAWAAADDVGLDARLTGSRWIPVHHPFSGPHSAWYPYEFLRDRLASEEFRGINPREVSEWRRFESAIEAEGVRRFRPSTLLQ